MPVRLSLLGPPTATVGARSAVLPCERRTQLVAYLAVRRSWVSRAELAALLWPEQQSKLALTNLRKALHRLQSLALAENVEIRGNALRVDLETDVRDFETALRERRLNDALALYTGPLLAGFDDAANEAWTRWLTFERERLQVAWRSAAQQVLESESDAVRASELAARLLDADPLDEDALRLYMSALARAGQLGRARQAYRSFVDRLRDELGLAPSTELASLHDALGSGAAVAAETIRPSDDGFIGRAVEIRRALSLIADDDCRLLSVTGPGGVGKTRLAQRIYHECAANFANGATFLLLDDLQSTEEFLGRLAGELGIALKSRAEPLAQIIDGLRTQHALLVFDNFEHLTPAASLLERLLVACPRVKAVVTSRVRLGLSVEWLLPLTGLPAPEPEDAAEIEAFDAGRLFIAAARRVDPALNATAEADSIVAICQTVEGLPLALELAAAWTRVLSCRDIATELERNADLLQATEGSRAARHASIEAVFEQSWRMLGEVERQALACLSVFRGGFSPSAARAVCRVALPVLAALVDKSLLRKEGARCYFHPLVHQFAHEKLVQTKDAAAQASVHGQHFLRYLADVSERVGRAEPDALRELDTEFENVRTAWRNGISSSATDELRRAAYPLMSYCDHRGRRLEGYELLQEALASERVMRDAHAVAALAAPAAWLAYRLDHYADAEALGMKTMSARENAGPGGDEMVVYRAATILGATCARLGRADEARDWFERALEVATEYGDPNNVASALDNLGLLLRTRGELDDALRLYRRALLKHREVDDAGGVAISLNNQAVIHILRNDLDAAQQALGEARDLCERHGLPSTRCMVEVNLANVALKRKAPERAASHARKAIEVSAQTGQRANGVEARHALIQSALSQHDVRTARAELALALQVSLAIGRRDLVVHAVWLFADLLAEEGEKTLAVHVLTLALEQPALVGAERAEAEERLRAWSGGNAGYHWRGPPIDELAQRIVAETDVAHAPLIASLADAHSASSRASV